jgi:methionine-rich copper-binding protein CopC
MIARRRALLAALAVASGLLAVGSALLPLAARAHSQLARSQPGRGAAVARAPERVRLWFSERLEPAYATLSVWSEAGVQVDAGDAGVDAADPTLLSVGAPNLAPGRYTVRYRVLSVDGHIVESSFAFTVKAASR